MKTNPLSLTKNKYWPRLTPGSRKRRLKMTVTTEALAVEIKHLENEEYYDSEDELADYRELTCNLVYGGPEKMHTQLETLGSSEVIRRLRERQRLSSESEMLAALPA
jgi:hypothetical protein